MTNQEFLALPVAKQRVIIAQDVLEQIESKKFLPSTGSYVQGLILYRFDSIQEKYDQINNCFVCALGACLLAATKYKNKVVYSDISGADNFVYSSNVREVLGSVFSAKQLLLIESAFEGYGMGAVCFAKKLKNVRLTEQEEKACKKFYKKYPSSSKRLIAIMENIIKNEGRFRIY